MNYELAESSWDNEEIEALNKVIQSGMFSMGENVENFENVFAKYMGTKYAVMVNSGSSANLIATASLFYTKNNPLKPGDEVIVPAISWSTTYYPLMQYGLKLKFVDVDIDTLNMDVSQLQSALTEKTKMIVGVSILGNPAALNVIRDFAAKNQLYFLEDNCESMDAELDNKKTGTFGDLNTFSFFFSHHISTMEGGMVLTDNEELYYLCKSLRNHGWTRGIPESSGLYSKSNDEFNEAYRFILPGYNVRPTELNGAVGIEQIKKLPSMTKARRKNLALFNELFGNDDRFILQRENGVSSAFAFTLVLTKDFEGCRQDYFEKLRRAKIGFRMVTGGCFLKHDVARYCDYETVNKLDNANYVHRNGFFVGNHPHCIEKELLLLHTTLAR